MKADAKERRGASVGRQVLGFPSTAAMLHVVDLVEGSELARESIGGRDNLGGASLDRQCAQFPMTDLGNTERFVARFKSEVLYCAKRGWFDFDGRRFLHDGADERVQKRAQLVARSIQDEAAAIRGTELDFEIEMSGKTVMYSDRLSMWGRASESAKGIAAIIKLSAPGLSVQGDELDADPMAINVLNGTLRIDKTVTGYIRCDPHNPADLITKLAPVEYDPLAEAPLWRAFLDQVQPARDGRKDVQRFLARWVGLALTGDTSEQQLAFFWGKGQNGKGTFTRGALRVCGDYADSIPIESFLDSGRARAGGQATPDLAKLPGVRFLTTSEPKRGATLDEGLVKLFTGEDRIDARHLNKEFFSFRPQAKLTMQGNYRPKISGTDEGIWRRMILVPWPVHIPRAQRDRKLVTRVIRTAGKAVSI